MEYQKLMLEKQDRVCLVKINHPEALNALNTVILQELDRAFDEIAADPETDVVILTGFLRKPLNIGIRFRRCSRHVSLPFYGIWFYK